MLRRTRGVRAARRPPRVRTSVALTVLASFLAAMPVRAESPYPTILGGPEATFGMASEFNQLFRLLSDQALRDIMCHLSGARFTPGRLRTVLNMPEGQVLRRINTLRGWGLVRMVRHGSTTTIVEPMPGEGSQTLRRWANRYCSEGDSCGRPAVNAEDHKKVAANSDHQEDGRMGVAAEAGGMVRQSGRESVHETERKGIQGTVLWYSLSKGYGFISPDDGSKEVFVHFNDIRRSGLSYLRNRQKVTFDLIRAKSGRRAAVNLNVAETSGNTEGQIVRRIVLSP